jgi:hypothetical protein
MTLGFISRYLLRTMAKPDRLRKQAEHTARKLSGQEGFEMTVVNHRAN